MFGVDVFAPETRRMAVTTTAYYSFHHKNDDHRVRLVHEIDTVTGQPLLEKQEWDRVKAGGNRAVKEWVDEKMSASDVVIVLVGGETAGRHWVRHEIEQAWEDGIPLLGVRIHGLAGAEGEVGEEGEDPFGRVDGVHGVPLFDPTQRDEHGEIDSAATLATLRERLPEWAGQGVIGA